MRAIATTALCVWLSICVLAQGAGWRANPDAVARAAAQEKRNVNYDEARVPPYTLPSLLGSGANATPAQWIARRNEILDLFRTTMFGRSPGPPEHVSFTISGDRPRRSVGKSRCTEGAQVSIV